ncbi:MAG: hypothetical protein ACNS63_08130 [Candidatus Nitrospinota bacterium M3_3B_026]
MILRAAALAIWLMTIPAAPAMADGLVAEPSKTLIAKPVDLVLTVDLRRGETARAPEKIALPEGVELEQVRQEGGEARRRFVYKIIPYRLGKITIPKVEYTVRSQDGGAERRETAPVSFVVESVRTDPTTADKLKDIRPQAKAGLSFSSYLFPLLAGAAAVAAIYLFWRWYSRRPEVESANAPEPPPPPCDAALAAISRLKSDDPLGAGRFQEHFSRLSRIVREYVERRYGVMALERTTAELEREIGHGGGPVPAVARAGLFKLLKACDIVKYAKKEPSRLQAAEALRRAVDFVEITRLKTEPENGGDEVR